MTTKEPNYDCEDRFLFDVGYLDNRIPYISLYLAGSMLLLFGWNRQETQLKGHALQGFRFTVFPALQQKYFWAQSGSLVLATCQKKFDLGRSLKVSRSNEGHAKLKKKIFEK